MLSVAISTPSNCKPILDQQLSQTPEEIITTYHDPTGQGIIEPFNQLDRGTLATSRRANKSDVCSRLDYQVQVAEDANAGASRVSEVDLFKSDLTTSGLLVNLSSLSRLRIDFRDLFDKIDDIGGGTFGGGNVGNEAEDVACLDTTEGNRLKNRRWLAEWLSVTIGTRTFKQTKNSNVVYSRLATKRDP